MRILIADDESIIRMGLKSMLTDLGHEVFAAVNGREALQMARRYNPDLAILDIKMPFTDGLQAAKTLSQKQPLPILILTAYSESDLVEQASDLPIHGYLIKPVDPDSLKAAIAIAHKRFEDSLSIAAKAERLEKALEERKLIDRAKGKLMKTGLDEEEAYRAIQRHARNNRPQAAMAILKWAKP